MESRIDEIDDQDVVPNLTTFMVGKVQFDYDENDPIFNRLGPNMNKTETEVCPTCQENPIDKKKVYCEYCACANCKTCCQKTRIYPNAKQGVNKGPRGNICKLCERKFQIRKVFADYRAKID